MGLKLDEVGFWSEVKLDIIKDYATAYSQILNAQQKPSFGHIYIDAFAGAGYHVSKKTKEFIPGSPLNALLIEPPFKEYHLIDLDQDKATNLRSIASEYPNTFVYNADCNDILLKEVFPKARYDQYKRALCILDPYGLHLHWEVIKTAGSMKSIEIFLNFPLYDMNLNVLWNKPDDVTPEQAARMTQFWGDESWRTAAYDLNLFGEKEKVRCIEVVKAFQKRLLNVAGFSYVPDPVPMPNEQGNIIYYLFFASQNPVAKDIVADVFKKAKERLRQWRKPK